MSNKANGRKLRDMNNVDYHINMGATVSGIRKTVENSINLKCPFTQPTVPMGMEGIINVKSR